MSTFKNTNSTIERLSLGGKLETTQEHIAKFPKRIVIDLEGLACKTRFGIVDPGEPGYQPLYVAERFTLEELDDMIIRVHNTRKPTPEEREAALVGSMFGWHVPGADPSYYTTKVILSGKHLSS